MLTALVASAKDIKTVMFTTNPQMQSADCGNRIKSRLQLENGVELIKTDLKEQKVLVKYDAEKTTPCKIVAAFSKLGYTTQPVEISQNACSKEGKPNCCKARQTICKVQLNACAAKNAGCSADKECKQACPKEAKECPNAGCSADKECKQACPKEAKECPNAGCSADKECKQACPKEAKECPNAGKECPKAKAGCAAKKQGGCCNGK